MANKTITVTGSRGSWKVTERPGNRVQRYSRKDVAVKRARGRANAMRARLLIFNSDNDIQEEVDYSDNGRNSGRGGTPFNFPSLI